MTHRLIAQAKRNGKTYIATALAETYAMRGEHVHVGIERCYNGTSFCDTFVKERFHWNGAAFASPSGENGGK